jgi:aldehyde dehydrogenase (NAD+)
MEKMQQFLTDAVELGAHIVTGGEIVAGTRKLVPTILSHVPRHARVMQEEIFGPILPVIPYDTTAEAIAFINTMERPLAFYAFGHRRIAKDLIRQVHAGGSCINHCALHYYNPGLPFGGSNHSGIGEAHGFAGFKAFSNLRSVYRQTWRHSPIDWLHPPYSKGKRRLIDFVVKWL